MMAGCSPLLLDTVFPRRRVAQQFPLAGLPSSGMHRLFYSNSNTARAPVRSSHRSHRVLAPHLGISDLAKRRYILNRWAAVLLINRTEVIKIITTHLTQSNAEKLMG